MGRGRGCPGRTPRRCWAPSGLRAIRPAGGCAVSRSSPRGVVCDRMTTALSARRPCAGAVPGRWGARLAVRTPPAAFVFGSGLGDGPLEGADGRAGDPVVQALGDEASGGTGEPARAARDGCGLLDVEDAGGRRRAGPSGELGVHLVAVGRGELVGPDRGTVRGVHDV